MSSFILSSFNEEDLVLKMNECQREYAQKNKEIKFFLNYGTVRFALSRQEKKIIQNVWEKMKAHYKMYEKVLKIDLTDTKKKSLTVLNKELNYFSQFDNFVGNLITIYYGIILENPGLVDGKLTQINKRPLLFDYLENFYPYHDELNVVQKVSEVLTFIDENIKKSRNYELFKIKVAIDSNKFFREQNKNVIELPSFSKMNKMMYSPNYGRSILNIWLPWAMQNYPKSKVDEVFADTFSSQNWISYFSLKDYFIESPEKRELIYKTLESLYESKDIKKNILFYEVLSNEQWQDYLNSKISKLSIKSIKLKRKRYQELLIMNKGLDYAILNLFKLGDFSREYFIYLLALKSYGISTTSILPIQ